MILKKITFCFVCITLLFGITTKVFADDDDSTIVEPAHSKDAIGAMLLQSVSLMGIPYRWGGNNPDTGMDCSGFIRYVFKTSLGITLPRTAAEMAKVGKRVSLDDLEPGDLLFFNTGRGSNTHIGMYIGDNKFIQSPRTGQNIQITVLNSSWRAKINGAKRIIQENEDENGNTIVESYQEIRDEPLPVARRAHRRSRSKRHHAGKSKHSSKYHGKSKKKSTR